MAATCRVAATLVVALFALALVAPGFAQNPNPDVIEKQGQRPQQEETTQQQAAQASGLSELNAATTEPTFEDVLAHPDDLELNYRYARAQIRRGDVKGASATLERIIEINPDVPQVRLLYGVVLFRLGNLPEADRELSDLIGENPSVGIKSQAQRFLRQVKGQEKATHLSGRLTAGMEYDDNRTFAPSSDRRLFGGIETQLTGPNERHGDSSQVYMGNLSLHHDLGTQAGHELFGTFDYYRAEQTQAKTLNLQAYSLQGGGVYKTPWLDVTPSAVFDHVLLAQTTFLREHGIDLRLSRKVDRQLSVWAELRDVFQEFQPTGVVASANDRTGLDVSLTGEADYLFTPAFRGGVNYNHEDKHAAQDFFMYDQNGAGLNCEVLLGKGTFAMAAANVSFDVYKAADLALSPIARRDWILQGDLTYGLPITLHGSDLNDLIFTLTYEYYQALSTVENYSYTNNKIAGLLTYKWDLGF